MSIYLENFQNVDDVLENFSAPEDALKDAEVLLAWYGDGSYCGEALVIYRKGGKLYEVNGSHCSCHGLESQWEPEETSPEALLKREIYNEYDGHAECQKRLHELAQSLLPASSINGERHDKR